MRDAKGEREEREGGRAHTLPSSSHGWLERKRRLSLLILGLSIVREG